MNYTTNNNLKLPEYTDQIDVQDFNDNFAIIDTGIFRVYTHVKSNTTHALTLTNGGPNIMFVATADFGNNNTFTVNGTSVTAKTANGNPLIEGYFKNGSVVHCVLSGTNLYFISGGSGNVSKTLTIAASDWSDNACTKSLSGVTANNNVIISPAPASFELYSSCLIRATAQGSGSLTFTCKKVPGESITVNVLIHG